MQKMNSEWYYWDNCDMVMVYGINDGSGDFITTVQHTHTGERY